MTHRYVVAGVRVSSHLALGGLATNGYSDLDLHVDFSADAPDGSIPIGGAEGTVAHLHRDTTGFTISPTESVTERGWAVRQVVPSVAAVLSRLTLHASGVLIHDTLTAFVGGSGSGKSTLAAALDAHGCPAVADDLAAVRFDPGPMAPAGPTLTPLGTVVFLERHDGAVTVEPLDPTSALHSLIRNGFGEHGSPDAWAFQFDAYLRLVEQVPHVRILVPDNLTRIDVTAAEVLTALADI